MKTTGERVMYREGYTDICISTDNGHYDGTIPELNVRKLTDSITLEHIITHPYVRNIMSGESYGSGYGNTSGLYIITPEQEQALKDINADATARIKKEQEEQDATNTAHYNKLRKNGLCPKCHTFCNGDCEN